MLLLSSWLSSVFKEHHVFCIQKIHDTIHRCLLFVGIKFWNDIWLNPSRKKTISVACLNWDKQSWIGFYQRSSHNGTINMINAIALLLLFALNAVASTTVLFSCCCRLVAEFFSLAGFVLFMKSTIYFTSLTWEETSRKWNTHHPPIVHRNIYDFIFNTHQNFTSNYHFSSYRVYLFDGNNSHENRKRFARFNSHSQDQARLWMSC